MSLIGGIGDIVGGVVDGVGDIVGGVVDGVGEILTPPNFPHKDPPEDPVVDNPKEETPPMCTQTGINPNRRTIVAAYAWIVAMKNGQEMWNRWYDISECGLEQLDAIRADLLANADHSTGTETFPVSQYHVYFEDGGHARPQIQYDMTQLELKSNHYYPEKAPAKLVPTPEYYEQEGIEQ